MREEIVEVMVKCKTNIGMMVARIVFWALCAVGLLGTMIGFGIGALVVAIVFGALGYFAGSKINTEYEYSYCNKEIDIDIIYNQASRKHIMTLEIDKMEALVRVNGNKMKEYANRQCAVKDFSSKLKENSDQVYAMFYDGNTKFLLEPGDRLLDALSYVAPRKIFKD